MMTMKMWMSGMTDRREEGDQVVVLDPVLANKEKSKRSLHVPMIVDLRPARSCSR